MGYRIAKVSEFLDEPVQTLRYWARFIPADVKTGKAGSAKLYSEINLIEFAMLKYFRDSGHADLNTALSILKVLRQGRYTDHKRDLSIKFDDFFTNPDWGKRKELFTISHPMGATLRFRQIILFAFEIIRFVTLKAVSG